LRLPWNPAYNALAYVLNGFGTVGDEKHPIKTGQLVTYRDGDLIVISADLNQESRAPSMDVLILGGLPIKEPVAWMGPFVMNTKAEVLKAFDDFQKGVLGIVPPDWNKANRPVNRDGIGYKLGGDIKGVHGTPDDLQETNN
jgi:redox-sensitive bicupin YhaK (pirin superfamily)